MRTAFNWQDWQMILMVSALHFLAGRAGIMRNLDPHDANPVIFLKFLPGDRS
jgi:hypothetical protein